MTDRVKKLYQSIVPISVIAVLVGISVLSTNGGGGLLKLAAPLESIKPTLASASIVAQNLVPILQKTAADLQNAAIDAAQNLSGASSGGPSAAPTAKNSNTAAATSTVKTATSTKTTSPAPTSTKTGGSARSTSTPSNPIVPVTTGAPDLEVKIIDTGILNNNNFIHADSINAGQKAAAVFDIRNVGTRISSQWNFLAQIPSPDGGFTSDIQAPLAPGEYMHFVLGFGNLNSKGANVISITVDPDSRVNDPNRKNNIASTTIIRGY